MRRRPDYDMTGDQVHDVWSHLRIISNINRSGAIHKPRLSGRAGGTLLHLRSDVSVTFPQWSGGHPGFYFIIPSSFPTPWNSAYLSSLSPHPQHRISTPSIFVYLHISDVNFLFLDSAVLVFSTSRNFFTSVYELLYLFAFLRLFSSASRAYDFGSNRHWPGG